MFGSGQYRNVTLLRGQVLRGLYSGVRIRDGAAVLVTERATDWSAVPVEEMRLVSAGVAPLLFAGALTLWTAFTGTHPYRLTEIGRILERILVADASRRPTVQEALEEFRQLAKQWNVMP